MASMKLCKPSFNYGASQSNFSKYEHQEHHQKSQSTHGEHGWATNPNYASSYYGQGQGSQIGRASYGFREDGLGHPWAHGSASYNAQAQSVLPTPSIHVQQAQHVMEKKQSSRAQDWGSNGAKYSGPTRINPSVAMTEKMKHGWANTSNQGSSPTRVSEYGTSMHHGHEGNAHQYTGDGANSGWASKPTNFSGTTMYRKHEQHGFTGGPTKYPSPVQINQASIAMHNEDHMVGKMDLGWGAPPTKVSTSSMAMHNEGHMMGKADHGWAGSPMKTNDSIVAMHKEEHVMGKMDHGWAASPVKANPPSFPMHKEDHMMGKMDHGWAPSPTKANHSSLPMHNEEHFMGQQMDHGYAGPNHLSHAMYKEQKHDGWGGKNGYSNGSAHWAHGSCNNHGYEDHEDVNDIMDEILAKYPDHNVSNGHGNWAVKPSISMGHIQASSYAKQEAWAGSSGSAHQGSGGHSMAWSARNEKKGAYPSSSNVSKHGMMSSGTTTPDISIGNDY